MWCCSLLHCPIETCLQPHITCFGRNSMPLSTSHLCESQVPHKYCRCWLLILTDGPYSWNITLYTVYPENMYMVMGVGCVCWSILSISFKVTSLAPGQSSDCPNASEAALKNMDEKIPWHHYVLITYPDSKVPGPAWGPYGSDRTQVGPILAPWTLLSG